MFQKLKATKIEFCGTADREDKYPELDNISNVYELLKLCEKHKKIYKDENGQFCLLTGNAGCSIECSTEYVSVVCEKYDASKLYFVFCNDLDDVESISKIYMIAPVEIGCFQKIIPKKSGIGVVEVLKNLPVTFFKCSDPKCLSGFEIDLSEYDVKDFHKFLNIFNDAGKIYKDDNGAGSLLTGGWDSSLRLFERDHIMLCIQTGNDSPNPQLIFCNEGEDPLHMADSWSLDPIIVGWFEIGDPRPCDCYDIGGFK